MTAGTAPGRGGERTAPRLRDEILSRFTKGVSRITAADDPDGLLREEGVLAALEARGFDVLFFEDPVAFRFAYETRFRTAWDRGETFDLAVVRSDEDIRLPFDLLDGAARVSLRLDEFFPNLSPAVVRELDPADRDLLFAVQHEAGRKTLGDNETRDFILRRLFGVTPETIHSPADLLELLLARHYAGRRFPKSLDDRLLRRLRPKKGLKGWPLPTILPNREVFFAFLEERWPLFLARQAGGATEAHADGATLALPGPRNLPFGDEKVRVYLDNLFVEGFLKPVRHPLAVPPAEPWVRAGVVHRETEAARERLERLLEIAGQSVPGQDDDHRAWRRFARSFAETRAALLTAEDPGPAAQDEFDQLERRVDEAFAAWLPHRYGALSSLPPLSPVMLHHVPHRIASEMADGDGKAALLVLDGLAFPQWVVLREELTRQRPRTSFAEDAVFAWIPTITAVSRQATFAGRPPFYFAPSIGSTAREPALWKAFWQSKGLNARQVGYAKGLGNDRLEEFEVMLGNPDLRTLGLVVNTVDDIMHGMQLGERGMQGQVRQWARQPFLADLLDRLLDRGFTVWLTSDHGNIEAVGCGSPGEGAVADLRGERVRTYSDKTLRDRVAAQFPKAIQWPPLGLPEDYFALLAPGRRAFVTEGKRPVCHGGASIEEVIVPLIHIGRATA